MIDQAHRNYRLASDANLADWYNEGDDATLPELRRRESTPAVSLSTDGGQHGSHCYDADGLLICGWPGEHRPISGTTTIHKQGILGTCECDVCQSYYKPTPIKYSNNPFRPRMLTGSTRAELDNVARMVAEADDLRS